MQHIDNCTILQPRHADCTNRGLSSMGTVVTVITDVPYKYTEWQGKRYYDRPDETAVRKYCHKKKLDEKRVLILCDKQNNNIYGPTLKPLDAIWKKDANGEERLGPMYGGNWAIVRGYDENGYRHSERAYPIHDRYETEAEYDTLSR